MSEPTYTYDDVLKVMAIASQDVYEALDYDDETDDVLAVLESAIRNYLSGKASNLDESVAITWDNEFEIRDGALRLKED